MSEKTTRLPGTSIITEGESINSKGGVTIDRRTEQDKYETIGFVIGTDECLSGWGDAEIASYFAVPFKTWEESKIIRENFKDRTEFRRVRIVGYNYKLRGGKGYHLSIQEYDPNAPFYTRNGFIYEVVRRPAHYKARREQLAQYGIVELSRQDLSKECPGSGLWGTLKAPSSTDEL